MAGFTVAGRTVALLLTPAEARALATLAGEGAEGMLEDKAAAAAYIGNAHAQAAARRALQALQDAARAADERRK